MITAEAVIVGILLFGPIFASLGILLAAGIKSPNRSHGRH